MSNSQNKKNEQQNNLCTTLTEQLKNGELETGKEYWVRLTDEWKNSIEQVYFNGDNFESFDVDDIKEVLAPVPSYEKLEELKIDNHNLNAWIKNFQPKYKEMEKENQQLKELLKKLHRDAQEIVLYSHDIADIDQEDWFTISRRQADVANNIAKDIYNAIGGK